MKDIIVSNKKLYELFVGKLKGSGITYRELNEYLIAKGIKMDVKRLQRFVNHHSENKITQAAYIHMLNKVGIRLEIKVNLADHVETTDQSVPEPG